LKRWWIIPALAGVLAVTGFAYWGYTQSRDKQQLLTYINNRNQRSFYELVGNVENVEVMLSKGIVSNSPTQRMMIFADIWQQAFAAQENLNQIPIAGPSITRTSKFLTQTGDFAWSLAKKYARNSPVSQEDIRKLNRLHTEAGYLAAELQKIEKSAADGRLSWGEMKGESDRKLRNRPVSVQVGLQRIDKNMEEFPTLIYDGPFSDHIANRAPKGLTGDKISREQAAAVARNFTEAGAKQAYRAVKTDNVNGNIPAYRIHLTPQNAKTPVVIVDVSKKGGHVLQMLNTRPVNRATISSEKAVSIARRFLADRNLADMEPTYVIEQQNTGVVIFQYKQDGVLIYPDLMKVKVALDTGEAVGFEGMGFVMNHRARKLPKPKISEQKALMAVNPQLKVKSKRLAVIPLENLQEVLAYEFKGELNGDTFIVYVNALTGEEERILKVVETNGGPVTI